MITVRKNRSVHIPQSDRQIGFENDHLVETRYFEITDPDILDFSFKLDIKNTMDIVDLYPVEKSDIRTVVGWDITSGVIGDGGIIEAQLRAFEANGERVWHSEVMQFTSGSSVNAVNEANDENIISEFEQIEKRVQTAVLKAEEAEAGAESYMTAAKQADVSANAALDEVNQKHNEIMIVADGIEDITSIAQQHYNNKNNPHEVTAEQTGAYTKDETDALFENASLDLSYHAGERNNPHKVTAEQTGAYTKDETDALLNHLPENVTLGGENALDKMYNTNFVNSITSFSDLAITGTSAVTNFGEVFSPYNKTADSRWIRISVNPAHFEKIAEMPYTISMTLRFFGSDVAVPLEIMGLYGREGDTDVRVTPMKDSWYMYPGYKKTFVFNLAPTSEAIKDAGFSIDLKAENYDSFQNMTFAIEAFSVIPAIDMDFSGEKPSFLKTGSIYHAVDSSFCENFSGNQVWFENGKIYSAFTKDIGYVDKAVAGAAIPVNHFLSNNTAKLGKVYTSSEVDALLGEKSDTSHIHGLATSGETVDLSQFGFKQSASGEYYVETNTETWEQADISFMQAGDNVEIIFSVDGGGFVYINDQVFDTTDGYSISNYTWEGILKKPIRVLTSLCVIQMQVVKKGKDGFMSSDDKTRLDNLEESIKSLQEAIKQLGAANA